MKYAVFTNTIINKYLLSNKILLFLIPMTIGILVINPSANGQNVNIPDANFKAYLVGNSAINTNLDSEIQTSEALAFTGTINFSNMGIADLTGIESFTALTALYCFNNSLTSLNVSANTDLKYLECDDNSLTSLDVSANTALIELVCFNNSLTSLNVSANTNLTYLQCGNNSLTSLDVSANTALTYLICGGNLLTSLDVSANAALTYLNCSWNQLTSLDVSANTVLTYLYCFYNSLTNLNVSSNTTLNDLNCSYNSLTSLNIKNGNNVNLTYFDATNNPSLNCLLVDDATYMNANWASAIDAGVSYNDVMCTVGVNLISSNEFNVGISPNPTKSTFVLEVTSSKNTVLNISLINSLGQVVLSNQSNLNIGLNKVNFDIQNQPSGVYFMSINYENNHFVKKIIKQ